MAEINYIVRILGKDLDGMKAVSESLRGIKGIDHRMGNIIANNFCKKNNVKKNLKLGELSLEQVKSLEDIISHPAKYDIPAWALNRQKEFESGADKHLTMNDLDFQLRNDFAMLAEIKSYRGLRHMWGLTVRGQKTRSTHRTKGKTVGVIKKDTTKVKPTDSKK